MDSHQDASPSKLDKSVTDFLALCGEELSTDLERMQMITEQVIRLRKHIQQHRSHTEDVFTFERDSIPGKRRRISWAHAEEYDLRTSSLLKLRLLSVSGIIFLAEDLCLAAENGGSDIVYSWTKIMQSSSALVGIIAREIDLALVPVLIRSLLEKDRIHKIQHPEELDFVFFLDSGCEALVVRRDVLDTVEAGLLFAISNFLRINCVSAVKIDDRLVILADETNELNQKFRSDDPLKNLDKTLQLNFQWTERPRSSPEILCKPLRLIIERNKKIVVQFEVMEADMLKEFNGIFRKRAPVIAESSALDDLRSALVKSTTELEGKDTKEIVRRIDSWRKEMVAKESASAARAWVDGGEELLTTSGTEEKVAGSADVDDPAKEPVRKRGRPAKASQNDKTGKGHPAIASSEGEEEVPVPVQLRRGRSNAALPNGNASASTVPAKKNATGKARKQEIESDDEDEKFLPTSGDDAVSSGDTTNAAPVADEDKPEARGVGRKPKIAAAVSNTGNDAAKDAGDDKAAAKKARGRAPKAAVDAVNLPSTPDQSDDLPTTSSNSNSTKKPRAKKAKDLLPPPEPESDPEPEDAGPAVTKKVIIKGRAPVDEIVADAHSLHVYEEEDDVYYAALNQTNIGNNNNKFYFIQLLEHDNRKEYHVLIRWGRVGATGQHSMDAFGSDLAAAKKLFCKKFSEKTKNKWEDRADVEKTPGKYDSIYRDYTDKDDAPADFPDSKAVKFNDKHDEHDSVSVSPF